jgi:uncharacterized iron-regulated protein
VTALRLVAALSLLACASPGSNSEPAQPLDPSPRPIEWQAPYGRDDPRAGGILDVATGRWIDEATLLEALRHADFVLLGERHDHPDHHALQARLIDALVARGRRPAVAFEMLDADDAPALASVRALDGDAAARAEVLRNAVAWERSGWPDWALYAPVFEAALAPDLPIVAANLGSAELAALRRGGTAALAPQRRTELLLDAPADPEEFRALSEQIREAHCGHAPEAALERMVDTQRAWNAQLARTLSHAPSGSPSTADPGAPRSAILIAGNEHVRRDRGVPRWLERMAPGARVVALGFLELDPREPELPPEHEIPFDFVWWTPRLDLEDPCDKYRDALERLRESDAPVPVTPSSARTDASAVARAASLARLDRLEALDGVEVLLDHSDDHVA